MNPSPAFCRVTQGGPCFAPKCDCWAYAIASSKHIDLVQRLRTYIPVEGQEGLQVRDRLRREAATEIEYQKQINDNLREHRAEIKRQLDEFECFVFELTGNEGDEDALTVLKRWVKEKVTT